MTQGVVEFLDGKEQDESRTLRTKIIRTAMEQRDAGGIQAIVESVPTLSDWEFLEPEQKLERMVDILQQPLWAINAQGDERTKPTKKNPLATPYHNLTMPWMENVYTHFGETIFLDRMKNRQMDQMIWEMGEEGKLPPGQDATEGYLELGSSTGGAPSLRQYYEGLKMQHKLWNIAKDAPNWDTARQQMEQVQNNQSEDLKKIYDVSKISILRTQSGTEAELLLSLFGVEGSQFTDETGSATLKAVSGKHPSPECWTGQKGLSGTIEGFESVSAPKEIKLREKGKVKNAEIIQNEVIEWIKSEHTIHPNKRLAIHITAGAKTGIGWENNGGLSLPDALTIRKQYGGFGGENIIIVADVAQNRLRTDDIALLVRNNILVNITGSKFAGGPMFSHAMLVSPEMAEIAKKWTNEHGVPKGLSDYVTKSDLASIVSESSMEHLYDLPDFLSTLKWAQAIPTMREYTQLLKNINARVQMLTLTKDLMTAFWSELQNRAQKSPKGIRWTCQTIGGQKSSLSNQGFEALVPFYLTQENQRLSVSQVKEFYRLLSKEIHIGQAVVVDSETQESVLRLAPSQEVLLRLSQESAKGKGAAYIRTLARRFAQKAADIMETEHIAATPLPEGLEKRQESRVSWTGLVNAMIESELGTEKSAEEKVNSSVKYLTQLIKDGRMAQVVVASGKNAAVLEVAHRAYVAAGLASELPVAYIDHPYATSGVYESLERSLHQYPEAHLYVFAGGETVTKIARQYPLRVTILSSERLPHAYVQKNPDWTSNMGAVSPEDAQKINQYYKGDPTDEMFAFFSGKYTNVSILYLRGNRRSQGGSREDTPWMQAAVDFFAAHPLLNLTDDELAKWMEEHNISVTLNYLDVFREIGRKTKPKKPTFQLNGGAIEKQIGKACALDDAFENRQASSTDTVFVGTGDATKP